MFPFRPEVGHRSLTSVVRITSHILAIGFRMARSSYRIRGSIGNDRHVSCALPPAMPCGCTLRTTFPFFSDRREF